MSGRAEANSESAEAARKISRKHVTWIATWIACKAFLHQVSNLHLLFFVGVQGRLIPAKSRTALHDDEAKASTLLCHHSDVLKSYEWHRRSVEATVRSDHSSAPKFSKITGDPRGSCAEVFRKHGHQKASRGHPPPF